jgi:hypothetical protein
MLRRRMPVTMRRVMVRAMPFAMMMLCRIRRSNTRNQHHRNDRNQNQLEDVFHVKSPDSLTLGAHIEAQFSAASHESLRRLSHRAKGVQGGCRDSTQPYYALWEFTQSTNSPSHRNAFRFCPGGGSQRSTLPNDLDRLAASGASGLWGEVATVSGFGGEVATRGL